MNTLARKQKHFKMIKEIIWFNILCGREEELENMFLYFDMSDN